MSEEHAVPAKPPAAAMKESLERIEAKLDTQLEGAEAFTKAIEKTCDTLVRRLDEPVVPGLQGSLEEILQVMRAEKQPARLNMPRLMSIALGLVLVSGGLGWYLGSAPTVVRQRASLMQHVNGILTERSQSLPADLRAKLATVYAQHGFPSPEQQRGGKP
jgi:hypothetical protein